MYGSEDWTLKPGWDCALCKGRYDQNFKGDVFICKVKLQLDCWKVPTSYEGAREGILRVSVFLE